MRTEERGPTAIPKTKGQIYEGIGFSFCKAATVLLLITLLQLGRFALPIVAGLTALFYVLAHFNGQRDTRCILNKPWVVASFWSFVAVVSLYILLR